MNQTSKICDHRNEAYDARNAFNEQWKTKQQSNVRVGNVTKLGLNNYSDKELLAKGGVVFSYNLSVPMRVNEYKELSPDNRHVYLKALREKYPGVSARAVTDMLGDSTMKTTVAQDMKDAGLYVQKRGINKEFDRIKFYAEMVYSTPKSDTKIDAPVVKEFVSDISINQLNIECEVVDLGTLIDRLGIVGRVRVSIEAVKGE